MMKRGFGSFVLLTLCLLIAGVCIARELGPGVYQGYFTIDRWGQKVFYNGARHFFVSDEVAKQLAPYKGKLLKLNVKSIYQPENPGGGIIDGLTNLSVEKTSALSLNLQTKNPAIKRGAGIKLHLTAHNKSTAEVKVVPNDMALVLVTNSPFSNAAIGYKDPQDQAYWYYREAVQPRGNSKSWLQVACRIVSLAWSPKEYAAQGKNVIVGPRTPDQRNPGYYYPLVVKPNGKIQIDVTIGAELLPGQYEVFLQRPRATSQRVKFDVTELGAKH